MQTNDEIDCPHHPKTLFEVLPGTSTAHFDGFMSSHSLQRHFSGGIPYPPPQQTRQSSAQQISSLSDAILQKFEPLFSSLQQHTTDQVQTLQAEVLSLSQTVQVATDKCQSDTQEAVKSFERLHELHMAEVRETRDRIIHLEEVVGNVAKSLDLTTIMERLFSIEHTVEGLAQEKHLEPTVAQTSSSQHLEPKIKDAGVVTEGSHPTQSTKSDVSKSISESFCPHYTPSNNRVSTPSLFSDSVAPGASLIQYGRTRYASPSRTLSPADWSRAAPSSHSSSGPPFNTYSSEGFRLLQRPRKATPDGTVAALRNHALGLSHVSLLDLPEPSSLNQDSTDPFAMSRASSSSPSSVPSMSYPVDTLGGSNEGREDDSPVDRLPTPPDMLFVEITDGKGSGEGGAIHLESLSEEEEVGEVLRVMSSRGSPMVYPKDLPLSPLSSLSDLASKLNSDPGPGPSIEELVLMAKKPVKATQGLSKKRKAQNQNPAESTSKRHRGKSRKKQNTRVTKSASKSPRKLCCAWPTIPRKDSEFNRQFIQCDGCKAWYHYGCVGIVVGDERLERDETFLCPPCSSKNDKGLLKPSERCRRPDCGYAEQGLDPDEYFVERIVGRKQVGRQQFIWLVKWEGYPISMAEWISGDAMQDHIKLAEQFIDDALAEGIDLVPEDTALLMEARRGGWVT